MAGSKGQWKSSGRVRLTGYLIATAGEDARRVVEQAEIMRLARADQIRFAEALVNPAKANQKLADAAKRHAQLFERQ